MNRKTIIIISILVILAGTGGIIGFYAYEGGHFVSTEDARVASNQVSVTPQLAGNVLSWMVTEGDMVQSGQIIGRQDLGATLNTGTLNPQTIGTVGGVIAEKAQLKAPISGQVIKSNAVVGQMAVPGTALAIIADTDHLYISARIKEADILKVKIGQTVEVKVDAFPGKVFSGRVENIGRATASSFSLLATGNDSGNYTKVVQVVPIKIQLLDAGGEPLMVGMNASITIHLD